MSNLDAVRTELERKGDRHETPAVRRIGTFAVILLLILGVVAGVAEIHLLPTFGPDEVSSILFGAG